MTYTEIIQVLANNILVYFEEVYHSAEIIVNDKNIKIPAVASGTEWIELSPTDQKEIIYIRRNGNDEVQDELKISSCGKSYRMQSSLRIVFFKDHAKNFSEILAHLMQSVLVGGTKLRSILQDKYKLQKDESSGEYNFGPTAAYFAIDIYALWDLKPDTCEQDFCTELQNPLRCPVVV